MTVEPEKAGEEGLSIGAVRPGDGSPMRRLLTLPEVAEFLAVSERTVKRLGIPHFKVGRQVRYDARSVSRWLETRKEQ